MIRALVRLHWLGIQRERQIFVYMLALPIVFFTIMTEIFREISDVDNMMATRIGVIDFDESTESRALIDKLLNESNFNVRLLDDILTDDFNKDDRRRTQLLEFRLTTIIEIPEGFGADVMWIPDERPRLDFYEDLSNPISAPMLAGSINAMLVEVAFGFETSLDEEEVNGEMERLTNGPDAEEEEGYFRIERIDAFGGGIKDVVISYSAAGISVLFLLFAMTGAAATLIDEEESGALERLLLSGVPPTYIVLCKWLFFGALGVVQTFAMFAWAWVVYDLDVFSPEKFVPFLALTAVTAYAAAAFGLLLAMLCKTRFQLIGASTVIVLIMSAIGGSMFPRYLMSETLQTIGLFTFNAWALDGYQKIFWYELPLESLIPQLSVLFGLAALFLMACLAATVRWRAQ